MAATTYHREPPWRAGLRGARANLLPGFVLQATALTLVFAYYHHPPTQAAFEQLSAFRAYAGFAFGIVSTGCFGGLLPFLYLRYIARTNGSYHWRQGLCLTAFWSYKGLEVDLWYRLLALVVGSGHDTATVVIKSLLDLTLYCTIVAIPVTVVFYQWLTPGINLRVLIADFQSPGWYSRSVLPTLIANAGVWTPAVAIIYALPTPLQLPLQNLVLMFFTLLLAHLNACQLDASSIK